LIIYSWGRGRPSFEQARKSAIRNADTVYNQLMNAASSENPLHEFLSCCSKYFDINITEPENQIRIISIEWTQDRPAAAQYVEDWDSSTRELL
jgi:hypothetical protein